MRDGEQTPTLSHSRNCFELQFEQHCVRSFTCSLALFLPCLSSFPVPPAYVTHRFTRPVAQWFFLASYDSPNFPVFVGNHVRYFPPISLHYLISYAVRTNVLSCQRSSSHVFTHGISTSVYSGFFYDTLLIGKFVI